MSRPAQPLLTNSAITYQGRVLLLSYEQNLPIGQSDVGLDQTDPTDLLLLARTGCFSGLVLPKGIARAYYGPEHAATPLVINLNGKTVLSGQSDPYAPQVCSVEEAGKLGAKAVLYHLYLGSAFEATMIKEAAAIIQQAHQAKLPAILAIHVSGKGLVDDQHSNLLAYAARVGLELAADYVQLRPATDISRYAHVTTAAGKCQVVATLPVDEEGIDDALGRQLMSAAAAGLSVGQSLASLANAKQLAKQLAQIVFGPGGKA